MIRTRLSRVRAISLSLSGALLLLAVIIFVSAPASLAQDSFTVSVSLYTDAGPRGVKVHVALDGGYVSGSQNWHDGTTAHTLTLSGALDKGLDGKPRIIVDVKDTWYRPSSGEGDPGT